MHYIGVNYHKKYSYVVVKDKDGKVGRRGKVNNRREEFRQFLKPYQQGKAVLEATRNWGLIYDWLEEILDDVALENLWKNLPSHVIFIIDSTQTDYHGAICSAIPPPLLVHLPNLLATQLPLNKSSVWVLRKPNSTV